MPANRTRIRSLRVLLLTGLVASIAALGASGASAAVTLDWTQPNVYDTAVPGTNRTWLGYITNSSSNAGPPSLGSQVAGDGATGPDVTTASERGADKLFAVAFPAASGSITEAVSPAYVEGEFTFTGKVTWTTHDTPITFTDPRIVFNGDGTGALYASGTNDTTTYGESSGPVFDLDLDGQAPDAGAPASSPGTQAGFPAATWKLNFDGTRTLSGIVPKIATPNTTATAIFGASYAAGVGPDRVPNRFGSFTISISPNTGPQGQPGSNGAAGVQGPVGPAGPAGKDASIKTITLKKAVFGKNAKLVARVTKNGKFVGYAELSGRKIKVTYITAKLEGTYKLTTVGAKKKRSASIKV
jgi:hypothetical protein